MNVLKWTWPTLAITTMTYWVILFAGWWRYTVRPSSQARARERAFSRAVPDPETGDVMVTLEHSIKIGRIAAIVFVPPLLLTLTWLLAPAL